MFTLISRDQEFNSDSWICRELNKDYADDYNGIFLHMLNSVDASTSPWLLKSALHTFSLNKLLEHHPNALIIMIHRPLGTVLPSLCSLSLSATDWNFDSTNTITRDNVGKRCCQFMDIVIECILKFRKTSNGVIKRLKNVFDINYNDLMKDPIDLVHRICNYFGLLWPDEMEIAMNHLAS
ncbi:unnamed protein product [Rotaria socialis]|uniref:Sulfotransferase n=1 Tax=Rotaria socialis TaxID=392032 RepID=A0A820GUK4_9BILA|nr:unnamed protein product [Rotaria socialis]CAF4285441.1 unnamed protein product [Rotaria socialis]